MTVRCASCLQAYGVGDHCQHCGAAEDAVVTVLREILTEKPDLAIRPDSNKVQCADRCPICGRGPLNGATGMEFDNKEDAPKNSRKIIPKDGDVSICCYCAGILCYVGEGETLGLRAATPEEEAELMELPEVRLSQAVMKSIQQERKSEKK